MRRLRKLVRVCAAALGAALAGGLVAAGRSRPALPDLGAQDLPPPLPPGRTVMVPGRGELFVRELPGPSTDAPVVVLLHGWMFPSDLHWFRTFDGLAEHTRVIAPDFRGHGRSSRPSTPFRLADVADDVAALLTELDAAPAIVVGYSMGGPVAQLLWQRHPESVSGLVLCATSDVYDLTTLDHWIWHGMGLLQVLLRLAPRRVAERLVLAQAHGRLPFRITRMIGASTPPEVSERLPWMVGEFQRGNAEDIAEAGRQLRRFDARGWICTIDVPTAVLVTQEDVLVPAERQHAMARRIPDATSLELTLDHDGVVSRPDVFVPALEKAITWVRTRS